MMRGMQSLNVAPGTIERGSTTKKVGITVIADLLDYFDGDRDRYERWEKQITLLRTSYELDDSECRILIGSRLKGRALEWFHSKPEFIQLTFEECIQELQAMYRYQPSKVVLANRIPIEDEAELVDEIIEGIPDTVLRNQARIQRFQNKSSVLAAFEKVELPAEVRQGRREQPRDTEPWKRPQGQVAALEPPVARCHNCGARGHSAAGCPLRAQRTKCYACQEFGHIAVNCPRRSSAAADSHPSNTPQTSKNNYAKVVNIGDCEIMALIDTGSDITLMRAAAHSELGFPPLRQNKISFCGIGSLANKTLGQFNTNISIDDTSYPINIHVVPDSLMRYNLLLGTDFLKTMEIRIKGEVIEIRGLREASPDGSDVADVLRIDVVAEENIDTSHIADAQLKSRVEYLVESYRPNRNREVGVEMSLVLKDEEPVYQRARRLSISEREIVNTIVREWLRDGIIQPSLSEYASPVVLVKKKDGTPRLCVDYRQLNRKIVRDRYPLPLIEDQLDSLQDARIYTTLDLKNGFFHVPIRPESQKYTAFIVPDGQNTLMPYSGN
ncbi:uncharacterized protein LOC122404231 [Colletes gigas]|uniref:uncharacterized protein LOC122404231 n=1 Tax=Colletes gigas TaxID=935657 RepID=UPI001C9A66EF|nr:uncharacterized protein LOC122404231 [Colletes gigas]